ncbi:hypothetical protein HKX48_008259, partial [Thoreauomyces humboldtii]
MNGSSSSSDDGHQHQKEAAAVTGSAVPIHEQPSKRERQDLDRAPCPPPPGYDISTPSSSSCSSSTQARQGTSAGEAEESEDTDMHIKKLLRKRRSTDVASVSQSKDDLLLKEDSLLDSSVPVVDTETVATSSLLVGDGRVDPASDASSGSTDAPSSLFLDVSEDVSHDVPQKDDQLRDEETVAPPAAQALDVPLEQPVPEKEATPPVAEASLVLPSAAEHLNLEQKLESIMNEAAADMDGDDLRTLIGERDKQVSTLQHEVETLKKAHDDLTAKLETQTQRIYELQHAYKAAKTVNRSLVEDAEAYQRSKSVGRASTDRVSPSDRKLGDIPEEESEDRSCLLDSGVASLDTSRIHTPRQSRRNSVELNDSHESCKEIIADLQDEVKALNLYVCKITSRIMSDDYLEQVLTNEPPASTDVPPVTQRRRRLPATVSPLNLSALSGLSSFPVSFKDSIKKRTSMPSIAFFRREPMSPFAETSAPPPSPLMIDSTKEEYALSQTLSPSWFSRMPFFGGGDSPTSRGTLTPEVDQAADGDGFVQMSAVSETPAQPA